MFSSTFCLLKTQFQCVCDAIGVHTGGLVRVVQSSKEAALYLLQASLSLLNKLGAVGKVHVLLEQVRALQNS